MKRIKADTDTSTGRWHIIVALNDEILESQLINQNSESAVVSNPKLDYTPLTNSGCESEFAKLDNRIKITGGTTSVQTLSRKNTVTTNAYLLDSNFLSMTDEEKRDCWKWARQFSEVKEVRKMEADFLATVKQTKHLALKKKRTAQKKRKVKNCLKYL